MGKVDHEKYNQMKANAEQAGAHENARDVLLLAKLPSITGSMGVGNGH